MIAYIPLTIDGDTLETCIKNKLKPHLIKIKTDTICYLSLKELKNEIFECITNITNHICSCTVCKKKYKFVNINKHKCYKHFENKLIKL